MQISKFDIRLYKCMSQVFTTEVSAVVSLALVILYKLISTYIKHKWPSVEEHPVASGASSVPSLVPELLAESRSERRSPDAAEHASPTAAAP